MKYCGRKADRNKYAASSAYRALTSDCRREISVPFLQDLRRRLSDPQKKLFAESLSGEVVANSVSRHGKVMEQAVLAHLARREACGQSGQQAVEGAIVDAVESRKAAQLRAMKGHWLNEGGKSSGATVSAARQALNALASDELASSILRGEIHATEKKVKKSMVSLDEDLQSDG